MTSTEVEILVHIAAPSRAIDDLSYRALAAAYLEFEPGKRIDLIEPPSSPAKQDSNRAQPPQELVSPQASFGSIWGNMGPVPGKANSPQSGIENSVDSWVPPPSEVEDSMPYHNISMPEFSTPTRILKYFLQNVSPPSENSQPTQRTEDTTVYDGGEDLLGLNGGYLSGPARSSNATGRPSVMDDEDGDDAATPNGLLGVSSQDGRESENRKSYNGSGNLISSLSLRKDVRGDEACPAPILSPSDVQVQHKRLGFAVDPVEVHCFIQGRPQVATSEDQMDVTNVSHVTQTPSSALRKRKIPLGPSPVQLEAHSQSPASSRGTEHCDLEPYQIIIPSSLQQPRCPNSEPPPSKRPTPNRVRTPPPSVRSSSCILYRSPLEITSIQDTAPGMATESYSQEDWRHHTEVVSPEPPAANNIAGTLPPRALDTLARKAGMRSRYTPVFPNGSPRSMRPFERGYWLLPLDADAGWSHQLKLTAWGFLGNFIYRDTRAGWGTRACRDPEWRWIRLYGWEHIAGHLYMLLYLASHRRAKLMDIWWFDGAGEALMLVRAKKEQDSTLVED